MLSNNKDNECCFLLWCNRENIIDDNDNKNEHDISFRMKEKN